MTAGAGPAPAAHPPAGGRRIYYGWIIIGLSFFTLAFHVTTLFSFGIFQVPLIEEFGWSRGALGGAYSLSLAFYALGSPFAGSLLEKKGPRAVMPWGSIILAGAMLGGFFVSSLWHVYLLLGLLGGLGMAFSGFAMHSAIVPRWFLAKRGRATGISLSGIGVGALFLAPSIERLIAHWGWRTAYLAFGLFILLIVAPLNFLLMRDGPEEMGLSKDGAPSPPGELPAPPDASGKKESGVGPVLRAVRGDPRFLGLVALVFFIGLNNNVILSQLLLYLVDTRYSMASAALIFGALGFIRTLGSISGGWVGDIIGRGRGSALSAGLVAAGLAILLLLPSLGGGPLAGYSFALVYGLGLGGMSACYSALSGDCFEGPSFGVIMGFMEISYALGGVIGPLFAGFMFDTTGSYFIPFSLIIASMIACIFISLWLQGITEKRKSGKG
ncbi:MAG: MFS transporter [bacterium]